MRIVVTGALGFIGHHLCIGLAKRGYKVLGIDNLSRGKRERIDLLKNHGVNVVLTDIRDCSNIVKVFQEFKPEIVMHLAALISVDESFKKPLLYEDVNVRGTINIVLASNKTNVWRIVYASSAAVYGNPVRLPIDEEHPLKPLSPYGVSKLAGEMYIKTIFNGEGGYVILRLFNVYGLGQNPEYAGVITKFMERLERRLPPIIYGDGTQTRDFIHVLDVVEAFIKAIEVNEPNIVLNIGTGKPTSIRELAYTMIKLYGLNIQPIYAPPRKGDIKYSYANISKAKKILKWEPRISLENGLRILIRKQKC